jgi:hypothetical protein
MLFKSIRASLTVAVFVLTSTALSSDTAPVSDLDMFYEASHAYSVAYHLVSYTARIIGGSLHERRLAFASWQQGNNIKQLEKDSITKR